MGGEHWTDTRLEVAKVHFLDWLYEVTKDNPIPNLGEYLDEPTLFRLEPDKLKTIIASLEQQGRIVVQSGLAGPLETSGSFTAAGRQEVADRHEQRANYRLRDTACQEAVLDWLYKIKREGQADAGTMKDFWLDPRAYCDGDLFTQDEVDNAIAYLFDKSLIRAFEVAEPPHYLRPSISTSGEDVIRHFDGSISAYLNQGAPVPTNQNVTHFHGPVSGSQVGIGSGITQTQNIGIEADDLKALLDAIRESTTDLSDSDAALARTWVDTIEAEALNDEGDRSFIQQTADRLNKLAARASNIAFTAAVTALVNALL